MNKDPRQVNINVDGNPAGFVPAGQPAVAAASTVMGQTGKAVTAPVAGQAAAVAAGQPVTAALGQLDPQAAQNVRANQQVAQNLQGAQAAPQAAQNVQVGIPSAPATPVMVNTQSARGDGLNKCPKCGSADISLLENSDKLVCHYCRHIFAPVAVSQAFKDADELSGEVIGSGAKDIAQVDTSHVTIKCQGCGAEIVIDTTEAMWARCHWCRQQLTIEHQISNGAVPDILLPFYLSKADAKAKISEFVKRRTMFANPTFKREFTTDNIIGVYLPYLVVDANMHCDIRGKGGRIARRYQVKHGDTTRTLYDIDVFDIGRDFDLAVSNLTVEASGDKLNMNSSVNTNNIINSILPFDLENAVSYNGNYLKGFNSERRDTNIDALRAVVDAQIDDISRHAANGTAADYNSGIVWESNNSKRHGIQWKAAYLPIWLYSYMQVNGDKKLLHYIAVNARTGETMGSVPLNKGRLLMATFAIEIVALIVIILVLLFVGLS